MAVPVPPPVGRVAQRTASSFRAPRRARSPRRRAARAGAWCGPARASSGRAPPGRSGPRRAAAATEPGAAPAGGGTGPARRSARPRSRRRSPCSPSRVPESVGVPGSPAGSCPESAAGSVRCSSRPATSWPSAPGRLRGMPCGTVSTPSATVAATAVMVVGASTNGAGRAGAGVRSAGIRGTGTRSGTPACGSRPGTVSGSTVRTGYGERPRTTTVPRSIVRRAASSSAAALVGPVATPYSIQRGPSTPTNSDDASPVRACSSRPHSPVNDRTVAPPSRSDSSISAARSGHSRSVRGAASALTESRPAGSMTCTACSRPSSGSTDTSPPRGTGTRTAPKSTRSGATGLSPTSSSSKGPCVGGPAPMSSPASPRPGPRAAHRFSARAPMVRAPGSSPGSTGSATDPLTAASRPPGIAFVRADEPRPRRAITNTHREAARARRWSRSHPRRARSPAGPGPRRIGCARRVAPPAARSGRRAGAPARPAGRG